MIRTESHHILADRLRAEHATLAARWFERLRDLLTVAARDVFPTESLLDHIPALIVDISVYLRAPHTEAIAANTLVVEKAPTGTIATGSPAWGSVSRSSPIASA